MKKIVLMLLTVGVLIACQEKQPVRFTTSSPEISTYKKMIDDYEKADWSSWATMYSDTAKIYFNNWDKASTIAEIQKGHESMNENFSSYEFDKDQMVIEQNLDDDGETWVNFWSLWKGKLKANGKEIHIPVHLTAQFVDGKVVEEYGFWDNSGYVAELQAIEAAAAAAEEETEDGE